jgi:hypothetical protein
VGYHVRFTHFPLAGLCVECDAREVDHAHS